MSRCPDCDSFVFNYQSGEWTIKICWDCGYYTSNDPGFKLIPNLFKNMVRENPQKFINKYLFRSRNNNKGAEVNKGAKP